MQLSRALAAALAALSALGADAEIVNHSVRARCGRGIFTPARD